MEISNKSKYTNIVISGKYATGTTTLAKNLVKSLGWKHINVGDIQRKYDREHDINENKQGALSRPDDHEKEMDEMTKKVLNTESNLIYEAWLGGFIARTILRKEKIPVNNTLVFSQAQIFAICLHEHIIQKLYGPTNELFPPFISPFVGRLDDMGTDGM